MLNLFQLFLLINRKSMDGIAIGQGNTKLTKAELKRKIELAMKVLVILGLKPGEVLMLHVPLSIEGVVLTFAANALGVKIAYSNFEGTEGEYLYEVKKYNARVIAKYCEGRPGRLSGIYFFRRVCDMSFRLAAYDEMMALAACANIKPRQRLFSRQEMFYLQTSGSTAVRPKGLPFTNSNVLYALLYAAKSTGTSTHSEEVEKALCVLNFRHPYGWMPLFVNLIGGNRVELATGTSPQSISEWHRLKPSYIYGTPQFLREFMRETSSEANLSFLRAFFCAGDITEEELFEEFAEFCKLHHADKAELRNNYGVGELLCVGTTSDGIPHKPGTSGKFYQGPTWAIVDERFRRVPTGQVGEIIVRSKTMISHYYQNEAETRAAFIQFEGKRFFRTGDYASVDEEGYVTIVGREKDFFQPYGASDKVNCETIRKPLSALKTLVKDSYVVVYVVEDPDSPRHKSKSACAFVVPREDVKRSPETAARIIRELSNTLQPFQLPTKLFFCDELPTTPAGKVDKKLLKLIAIDPAYKPDYQS